MKIFLPLFILTFSCFAFGQTIATTEDGKKVILKADKTWDYAPGPEKQTQAALSENKYTVPFPGDSIKEVLDFFNSKRKEMNKSEFETTEGYSRRLEAYRSAAKPGNKTLSEFVFVIAPEFNYDAETKRFQVNITGFSVNSESDALTKRKPAIRFNNKVQYSGEFINFYPDMDFDMEPQKAEEVKDDLRLAVYSMPIKALTENLLDIYPNKIVVFNQKTGEIYKTLQSIPPYPPRPPIARGK